MASRTDYSFNRKLYVGTTAEINVADDNAIIQGRVGIGSTSAPSASLDVYGETGDDRVARFESPDDGAYIQIRDDDTLGQVTVKDNVMAMGLGGVHPGTTMLNINTSGSVGIKTASPDGDLEVIASTAVSGASDTVNNVIIGLQSANRPTILLDTADTTYTNRTWNITNVGSAGKLFIGRNGLDVMVMDNDGKVGIGTADPASKLEVSGRISGGELGSPDVCRNGLLFYVDFNNKACISGTSATEVPIDLGPQNLQMSLVGGANFEYKDGIGCYYFDGSNDHILVENYVVADTVNSYEIWHYAVAQSTYETWWDSGTERPLLGTYNDDLIAYPAYNQTSLGDPINPGKWYHVVWAMNGNTDMDIFVNGKRTHEGLTGNMQQRTGTFSAMLGGDTSAETTNGFIAITRTYSRQLTPADVLQNYNAEVERFAPVTPSLGIVQIYGNVGIGTNTPATLLQVGNTPTSGGSAISAYGYDGAAQLFTTRAESNFNTSLYLYNNPVGEPGTGTGIMFRARSSTTNSQQQATVYSSWTTNTHASRTAKLVFQTANSGAMSDKMTILGNGNVGIGTDAPSDYDGESDDLVVASGVDGAVPTPGITIACLGNTATTGRGALRFADGTSSNAPYRGALEYNHNGDSMFFRTAGTYKMTILSGGNVGIGTTSINGAFGASNTVLAVKGKTSGGEGIIQITGLGNNATDNVGVLAFHSQAEADAMCSIRSVRGNADDVGTMTFLTNNGGTESEKMRISNTGDIKFNAYDATNNTGTPTFLLGTDAAGNVVKTQTGATTGTQVHSLPATGGTARWTNFGTFTAAHGGQSIFIQIVTNNGYNSTTNQNLEINLRFKTSNGGSLDPSGFSGDSSFYTTGENSSIPAGNIKWVANAGGTSASSYQLYVLLPQYTGNGGFYMSENAKGTWVNNMTFTTDPGAASSTVMIPAEKFTINGGDFVVNGGGGISTFAGNVTVGATSSPGRVLEVNGGSTQDGGIKLKTSNTAANFWSGIEFTNTFTSSFLYLSANDSGGTFKFYPAGSLKATIDGGGTWLGAGDVIAYGSPSDIRLKENIKPIESALDKVMKLKGVTFDWIQKEDQILDIKEDIGFIAQDVKKVIPELVRENENGMLSMRHQGIAPILLEAIKELKAEIEDLKKQIK